MGMLQTTVVEVPVFQIDWRDLLESIAHVLVENSQKHIDTGGSGSPVVWEWYRSKKYERWKRKRYGHTKLLILTGRMRNEIAPRVDVVKKIAEAVATTDYAFIHQEGTPLVPKRPFMYFTPQEIDEIHNMIAAYIAKVFE